MRKHFYLLLTFTIISFSQNKKTEVVEFNVKNCEMGKVLSRINERIVSLNYVKDTLTIKIGIVSDCGTFEKGFVKIQKDSIYLTTKKYGDENEHVECDCYFELEFKLTPIEYKNQQIFYENKKIFVSDSLYLPASYHNGNLVYDNNAFYYYWKFYNNGKTKSITITKSNFREVIHFYENGLIKKNTQTFFEFGNHILKEWNENGKLIKYENLALEYMNAEDYSKLKYN